jgi:hypothetical protein
LNLQGDDFQTFHIYFLSDPISSTAAPAIMMALLTIAICVSMVILSKSAMSKQWFREWIRETVTLLCAFISI